MGIYALISKNEFSTVGFFNFFSKIIFFLNISMSLSVFWYVYIYITKWIIMKDVISSNIVLLMTLLMFAWGFEALTHWMCHYRHR